MCQNLYYFLSESNVKILLNNKSTLCFSMSCVRHCAKNCKNIISVKQNNILILKVFLSLFYRWRKWGLARLSNWPNIIQWISRGSIIWTIISMMPKLMVLSIMLYKNHKILLYIIRKSLPQKYMGHSDQTKIFLFFESYNLFFLRGSKALASISKLYSL